MWAITTRRTAKIVLGVGFQGCGGTPREGKDLDGIRLIGHSPPHATTARPTTTTTARTQLGALPTLFELMFSIICPMGVTLCLSRFVCQGKCLLVFSRGYCRKVTYPVPVDIPNPPLLDTALNLRCNVPEQAGDLVLPFWKEGVVVGPNV